MVPGYTDIEWEPSLGYYQSCRSCKSENRKKDILLEICGNRYFKISKDKSTRFTTQLVSKRGVYSYNIESC